MASTEANDRRRSPLPAPGVMTVIVILSATLLWPMAGLGGGHAGGAMRHSVAEHGQRAATSDVNPSHDRDLGHDHKQGKVAVVASVLGIVVVIVLIVMLGSLSVRRRMRDSPTRKGGGERGPPEPRRGLFG